MWRAKHRYKCNQGFDLEHDLEPVTSTNHILADKESQPFGTDLCKYYKYLMNIIEVSLSVFSEATDITVNV